MTQKTISQRKFDQVAKESFWKALKPRGFKKAAYHFFCQKDGWGQVLNLQRYVPGEPGNTHFTINVGLYFPEYQKAKRPNDTLPEFPKEHDCALRFRIGELMKSADTWFDIDSDTDEVAVTRKMNGLMETYILPFFDKYSDKSSVLDDLPKLTLANNDQALILLAENGRTADARAQYVRMLKEAGDPAWVSRLGRRYGLTTDPGPGEAPKRKDSAGGQNHRLKKCLDAMLAVYRDMRVQTATWIPYDLEVDGDRVRLCIEGKQSPTVVEGQISAWMFLCANYWAQVQGNEVRELYPHGDIDIEDYDMHQNGLILDALLEAGLYFLDQGEEFEARQCFFALTLQGRNDDAMLPKRLAKIPEKLRPADADDIERRLWNGRRSITALGSAETMQAYCNDRDPIVRYHALDFLIVKTDASVKTARKIHELVMKSVVPCVSDRAGTVRYVALRCLEDWVTTIDEQIDVSFYRDLLPCVRLLLAHGINTARNRRYEWVCLTGSHQYENAERVWPLIEKTMRDKADRNYDWNRHHYIDDLTDWRLLMLSRVAQAYLLQKKLDKEQLMYVERLVNEAVRLAEPKVAKSRGKENRGVLSEPYAALAKLRETQGRLPEALDAYQKATKLKRSVGYNWADYKFGKSILVRG
jgi:hypothetical protein